MGAFYRQQNPLDLSVVRREGKYFPLHSGYFSRKDKDNIPKGILKTVRIVSVVNILKYEPQDGDKVIVFKALTNFELGLKPYRLIVGTVTGQFRHLVNGYNVLDSNGKKWYIFKTEEMYPFDEKTWKTMQQLEGACMRLLRSVIDHVAAMGRELTKSMAIQLKNSEDVKEAFQNSLRDNKELYDRLAKHDQ